MSTAPIDTREIAVRPEPMPVPQYVQGFEGLATQPFPKEACDVLGAKVNPEEVEIKPNGIVFLPGVAYRRILTRAFGPGGWALAPRSPARRDGDVVVYHGALFALGRFVSEAMGECAYRPGNENMTYATALEGARTDCLTRCCKDLGIAAELWDKDWREWWQGKYTEKKWVDGEGGKRGKYVWNKLGRSKKDAPMGRNAAAPEATPVPKAAAPIDTATAPTAVNDASSSSPSTAAADPGEAPDEKLMKELLACVGDLKWAVPKRNNWLKKHFDAANVNALTKMQAATVLQLLLAWGQSKEAYEAAMAKAIAEGLAK